MHEKELFRGLTTQEAKQRIEKFGLNEITEKKKVSAIKILLHLLLSKNYIIKKINFYSIISTS